MPAATRLHPEQAGYLTGDVAPGAIANRANAQDAAAINVRQKHIAQRIDQPIWWHIHRVERRDQARRTPHPSCNVPLPKTTDC
jgi:hypothetical protein